MQLYFLHLLHHAIILFEEVFFRVIYIIALLHVKKFTNLFFLKRLIVFFQTF